MSNFSIDSDIEKLNAPIVKGLLESIYSVYGENVVSEVNGAVLQKQGVDYICETPNGKHYIDVKMPSDYFNRPEELVTWVIEICNLYNDNTEVHLGWGVKESLTTFWLWIKPLKSCSYSNKCTTFEFIFVNKNQFIDIFTEHYMQSCINSNLGTDVISKIEDKIKNCSCKIISKELDSCIDNRCKFLIYSALHFLDTKIGGNKELGEIASTSIKLCTNKTEHPIVAVVPWKLYQILSDMLGWTHYICEVKEDSYNYIEYSDKEAERYLGKTYVDSLNSKIKNSELTQLKNIVNKYKIDRRL